MHPSVMMRRDAVMAVGRYRPATEYAEDYDLWLRMGGAFISSQILTRRLSIIDGVDPRLHAPQIGDKKFCPRFGDLISNPAANWKIGSRSKISLGLSIEKIRNLISMMKLEILYQPDNAVEMDTVLKVHSFARVDQSHA